MNHPTPPSLTFTRVRSRAASLIALTLTLGAAACGPAGGTSDAGSSEAGSDASTVDVAPGPPRCSATPPPCSDQQAMALPFRDNVAAGVITEETPAAPGEFATHIDATGGGLMMTQSFVYAQFTSRGLLKVDISDEQAITSMDWDIAFRRYVMRINSGVGGPSCVEAARTQPGTEFETVTSTPSGLTYRTEEYFTPGSCDLVSDGSGLPGSPGTALASFWTYESCVQMSGYTYVVHLRDGRRVKLKVLSYYNPDAQAVCDETGTVPMPNGSGNIRIRWAFIP